MKRIITLFFALMLIGTTCFAGKAKVKVTSGSTNCLKEAAAAIVEFDFSATTWHEKENFKTWCGDQYDQRVEAIKAQFESSFNEKTKGMKIDNNAADAKYKIVVVIKDLDRMQAKWGNWGQGTFLTKSVITIYDKATNESLCEIVADEYGTGKDYDYKDGLGKCFKGLAEEIMKL